MCGVSTPCCYTRVTVVTSPNKQRLIVARKIILSSKIDWSNSKKTFGENGDNGF